MFKYRIFFLFKINIELYVHYICLATRERVHENSFFRPYENIKKLQFFFFLYIYIHVSVSISDLDVKTNGIYSDFTRIGIFTEGRASDEL